jgi:hypothetical protein
MAYCRWIPWPLCRAGTSRQFEQADCDEKGETTVLQNRMHLSQQKFFDLLCTHIYMPLLHSAAIPCISTHNPPSCRRPVPLQTSRRTTRHTAWITRPSPSSSPPRRTDRPGGAGSGSGVATPARRPAPSASDDEETSHLITPAADDHRAPSPILDALTSPNGGLAEGTRHPRLQDFSPLLSSAKLTCEGGNTHIEIFHDSIFKTVWFAIWRRRYVGYDIMVNIMVDIMVDIIKPRYHKLLIS